MNSPLLMPGKDMANFGMLGHFIININDSAARIAEQHINAFPFQGFQQNIRAGALHLVISFEIICQIGRASCRERV